MVTERPRSRNKNADSRIQTPLYYTYNYAKLKSGGLIFRVKEIIGILKFIFYEILIKMFI